MPLSKRRQLLIISMIILFVALLCPLLIWGFSIEISDVLIQSALFPNSKLLMALGSFLGGCLMATIFAFAIHPPPSQGRDRFSWA